MVNWNAEADAKLLAIILDVHQVKVDYNEVATQFGEGVTAKAITHRVANIKARVRATKEGSAPATPTGKQTPSGRKKRTRTDNPADDEEEFSPSKKPRRVPARGKATKKAKEEFVDEQNEDVNDAEEDEDTSAVNAEEVGEEKYQSAQEEQRDENAEI